MKISAGPWGWRELRMATSAPASLASSMQFPWALLRPLLRYRAPGSSPAGTPL